ncbi:uncharacterized protein [Panulirus ornatus]|uniref:uncharacterized protein n=1 Tax=Panulirus ornatus TaxID=150431 RepID=UPI003A87AD9A
MAEAAPIMGEMNGVHLSPAAAEGASYSRRYSSDDIGCHYSSLTQPQVISPVTAPEDWDALDRPSSRRQSVATVQTEDRYRSPRPGGHRRRSELSAQDKRRKSRGDTDTLMDPADMNGVRRGTRGSNALSPYDLESARLSLSSGRQRKSSRHSNGDPSGELDEEEQRRSRAVLVCASVAVAIFLIAILLVAITLRMSPAIDEMGK